MSSISFDNCHDTNTYYNTKYWRHIMLRILACYKINKKIRKNEERKASRTLCSDRRKKIIYPAEEWRLLLSNLQLSKLMPQVGTACLQFSTNHVNTNDNLSYRPFKKFWCNVIIYARNLNLHMLKWLLKNFVMCILPVVNYTQECIM